MSPQHPSPETDPFACFHPVTAEWFKAVFEAPTAPQRLGWPVIARGESALILAPTGTGKTLTAFLWCLDRLMLHNLPAAPQGQLAPIGQQEALKGHDFSRAKKASKSRRALAPAGMQVHPQTTKPGCRILYVSPLKALAVDVERNLRSPLAGIANMARRRGIPFHEPQISVRTGDTPQRERARFLREPTDILITTPESLYLMLTSQAAEALRTVDTVIIDEIHALVPTKRGAHLALSLERLEALVKTGGSPRAGPRPWGVSAASNASASPPPSVRSKKLPASSAVWKSLWETELRLCNLNRSLKIQAFTMKLFKD